jgi:hypothetical protein
MLESVSFKITTTYTIELYWHGCCFIKLDFCNPGYVDLLIIDGNHLKQLDVLKDESHMQLIMKDGKIYKNTL